MMITSAPRDAFGHVVADAHAHLLEVAGNERLRADGADLGRAERGQRVDVGAGDARVDDVADDRHRELREVLLVVADRVHVEQALRRVRVAAVAGVDHVHVRRAVLRDEIGRAALRVADDEHVGVHRRKVGDRVEQALALGGARARDVEVDDVGREALGGDLEGRPRPRRVLEEEVEDALAAQERHLLDVALVDAQERPAVSRMCCSVAAAALDREQMDQFVVALSWGCGDRT
jgi:hypothetical protein